MSILPVAWRSTHRHRPWWRRDAREQGIPLQTLKVKGSDGRSIAAYAFDLSAPLRGDRIAGRIVFPKSLKAELAVEHGPRCSICLRVYELRYLQIDHRIPYEVAAESPGRAVTAAEQFMLICGSCNRAKSWSCEHCLNLLEAKSIDVCSTCYWAVPANYSHIALREIRRVEVIWAEHEIATYEKLKRDAEAAHEELPLFVKRVLESRTNPMSKP